MRREGEREGKEGGEREGERDGERKEERGRRGEREGKQRKMEERVLFNNTMATHTLLSSSSILLYLRKGCTTGAT